MTQFWEVQSADAEFAMGKNFVDAAVAAQLPHLIFSALDNTDQLSNGELSVPAFMSKARILEYIKSTSKHQRSDCQVSIGRL